MSVNDGPTNGSNDSALETVKWVAITVTTVMGIIIVALTLFTGLTLNAEKSSLRALENDVKQRMDEQIERVNVALSQVERKPEVVALSRRGEPLNGRTIQAILKREGNEDVLFFTIIFKNIGTATTDPLFVKTYSKKPLIMSKTKTESSDEVDYDYEGFSTESFSAKQTTVLPAQASFSILMKATVFGIEKRPAKYPILVKIYYGSASPHVSEFFINVTSKTF